MKVFFTLTCTILIALSVNGNENSIDIDLQKVKVHPSTLIMKPLVEALENKTYRKVKGRIINGSNATSMTRFPFQVKLFLKSGEESTDIEEIYLTCGASIISRNWLVTAAHCLDKSLGGWIFVGCLNWKNKRDRNCKRIRVEPDSYIWHADYYTSERDTQNDIGLIELKEPLTFSKSVNAIELNRDPVIRSGTSVVVSGYGITETGKLSDRLKFTRRQIISLRQCRKTFDTVGKSMICYGPGGGTSDCQGDSGGPMTMNVKGKIKLIGVTSFGGPTCLHYPGVYSRISYFLPWICELSGLGC